MSAPSLLTIHTVGHSTRSFEELVAILDDADSWPLVDIRTYPGSKRYPHFNRAALEAELGNRYVHIPALGGRRRSTRIDSPNDGWKHPSFRSYADHMGTEEFREGIEELEAIGGTIMCSEAVWWRCHRRMVSDALVVRGHRVVHLGLGRPQEHRLTEFAVTEPTLHYPSQELALV